MYYRTEGVILSRRNFGEADRILTIYTRDLGKVIAIAKGVRRPRSKKSGHVEIGNWCKFFIARGKNLDLVAEVELKRPFGIKDFSEEKANKIYHLLELVDSLTAEKQKNLQVFILLVHYLKRIPHDEFELLSLVFKIKLLATLGFFSAKNLKDSQGKNLLQMIETLPYDQIKNGLKLTRFSQLKLLKFLDSMIENLTLKKLKTTKFLNAQ